MAKEMDIMIIYMLATAMTIAMLIGTVFALQQEASRVKLQAKRADPRGFGYRYLD